MMFGVNDY